MSRTHASMETLMESWTLTAMNITNYFATYYYGHNKANEMEDTTMAMLSVGSTAVETYKRWMSHADKRVENWPLMSSPWPTCAIGVTYVVMCLFGPRLMANQKPVNRLRPLIVAYNILIAGFNMYIGLELLATSR